MLYQKSLNSIEELRAERLRIAQEALKKIDKIEESKSKKNSNNDFDFLVVEKVQDFTNKLWGHTQYAPLINAANKLIIPFILEQAAVKGTRMITTKVIKDILIGYAKWKAISLVLGYLSDQIKEKRKHNFKNSR